MITEPDGIEVVATRAHAASLASPPLLILESLTEFLDARELGSGPLSWLRIGDGQSNLTYRIQRDGLDVVLRRGPRPPHPRSTHDMVREARIQRLVGAAGVPVPQILAVGDDESVLGVTFYLMGFLDGEVVTTAVPSALEGSRRELVFAAVDALADLHRIDVTQGELAKLGRPDGYLERQVRLFSGLWNHNTERSIPDVAEIGAWLAAHVPTTAVHSVVHGDYRLGNLMFAPSAPARIRAILDWELATIGDPLADVGYFVATYAAPDRPATVMELTPATRDEGFPTRAEVLTRYSASSGRYLGDLDWYEALALWKSAIFCEAMYTRWLNGERPGDTFAPLLERGVPDLVEAAGRRAHDG